MQSETEKLLPLGFGCFVGSDKTVCALCVLLLTATSLRRCICNVAAWGNDHSRRGIVYRNVFWNYCMTMPQNGLAGWHVTMCYNQKWCLQRTGCLGTIPAWR